MTRPPRVVGLDLGMTRAHPTGWAWSVGPSVQSGQVVLEARSRKTRGRRFEFFRDWFVALVGSVGPDLVAYEMPPLAKGGLQGRLSLLGLVVVTEEVASRWGVDVAAVAPSSLKKFITGDGRASKDAVEAAVLARYPDQAPFLGPDQADALAVLEWGRTTVLGLDPRGKAGET